MQTLKALIVFALLLGIACLTHAEDSLEEAKIGSGAKFLETSGKGSAEGAVSASGMGSGHAADAPDPVGAAKGLKTSQPPAPKELKGDRLDESAGTLAGGAVGAVAGTAAGAPFGMAWPGMLAGGLCGALIGGWMARRKDDEPGALEKHVNERNKMLEDLTR